MVRPTIIGFHPTKLKSYPFMIRLDRFTGRCNV